MSAIDEVKARLDIVDVIGAYVPLKKAGRYFKANCPFHTEKTPSFIVYPDRQSWHCFGACGTGGDVIGFVSRKENLDFGATLRLLADRAGVELQSGGPRREELKTLYDVNESTSLYFHSLLLRGGSAALVYAEERGIDRTAMADFQIGFSPPGWDGLKAHLTSRGFPEAMLVEAGLLIEGERGTYDRFRERLMFPIRDERGRVVGFGGRVLPQSATAGDPGPKYINTPQTPIFDKGSVLYALDRAKDIVRRDGTAVIVEGYMDVVAAHQHGFRNVVASMGTSLTDKQAMLAQRFAKKVVLAMDADEAGNAAALRGIQVVAAAADKGPAFPARRDARLGGTQSLDLRVLVLPQGVDPDDLIRKDAAGWARLVEESRPVVDHLLAVATAGRDLSQPRERSVLVAEVLPAIGDIADPVLKAHYLQRLSRLARVDEETLRRQLRANQSTPRRRGERQGGSDGAPAPAAPPKPLRAPKEEFCLAMLFRVPEVGPLADVLTEDVFTFSENRELFRRWRDGEAVSEDDPGLWEQYQTILETRLPVSETSVAQAAFLDCVGRLEQGRMKAVKEASALALAEGEAGVRPGQVASIARARWEAGLEEEPQEDGTAEAVASQLLQDMEAGLRFHRRLIESSRPDQLGKLD